MHAARAAPKLARAAAVLLGIGVVVWVYVEGDRVRAHRDVERSESTPDAGARAPSVEAKPGQTPADDASQLDLSAMSQTFRHSTLLIAIRDAGFYCDDVVTAHETASGVWIAGCRDLRGYKIEAGGAGRYRVEPIPHQVDYVF